MQYQPFTCGLGNTTVVPASEGQLVEVLAIFFQCSALTTMQLRSATTPLTGSMSFTTGGGLNLPAQDGNEALFRTAIGEALVINIPGLTGGCGGGIMWQYST